MSKWDKRYLELAKLISSWSKDPRKQVGAVITYKNYVRGVGFNGFPKGIEDSPERLNTQGLKLPLMIHAEVNALIAAQGKGDTIYVYPCLPCSQCLGQIIQSNIERIVTIEPKLMSSKWDVDLTLALAKEAGITVTLYSDSLTGEES